MKWKELKTKLKQTKQLWASGELKCPECGSWFEENYIYYQCKLCKSWHRKYGFENEDYHIDWGQRQKKAGIKIEP